MKLWYLVLEKCFFFFQVLLELRKQRCEKCNSHHFPHLSFGFMTRVQTAISVEIIKLSPRAHSDLTFHVCSFLKLNSVFRLIAPLFLQFDGGRSWLSCDICEGTKERIWPKIVFMQEMIFAEEIIFQLNEEKHRKMASKQAFVFFTFFCLLSRTSSSFLCRVNNENWH